MPVAASWRDIFILIDNTKKNRDRIEKLTDTLEEQLNTLGTTFLDEGIRTIQGHIFKTREQIKLASDDFKRLETSLITYACLLKKAEDATSYQNERTR